MQLRIRRRGLAYSAMSTQAPTTIVSVMTDDIPGLSPVGLDPISSVHAPYGGRCSSRLRLDTLLANRRIGFCLVEAGPHRQTAGDWSPVRRRLIVAITLVLALWNLSGCGGSSFTSDEQSLIYHVDNQLSIAAVAVKPSGRSIVSWGNSICGNFETGVSISDLYMQNEQQLVSWGEPIDDMYGTAEQLLQPPFTDLCPQDSDAFTSEEQQFSNQVDSGAIPEPLISGEPCPPPGPGICRESAPPTSPATSTPTTAQPSTPTTAQTPTTTVACSGTLSATATLGPVPATGTQKIYGTLTNNSNTLMSVENLETSDPSQSAPVSVNLTLFPGVTSNWTATFLSFNSPPSSISIIGFTNGAAEAGGAQKLFPLSDPCAALSP